MPLHPPPQPFPRKRERGFDLPLPLAGEGRGPRSGKGGGCQGNAPRSGKGGGCDGFALIAVLWGVVLLGLVAAGIATAVRTDAKIARNLVENAKARALADGGPAIAVAWLFHPDPERRWPLDQATHQIRAGEGMLSVTVEDEAGKVDLNAATAPLLATLFAAAGAEPDRAERLAAAVVDWRDPDQLTSAMGAEDTDYALAGLPWRTKGGPFDHVAELRRVIGMDDRLWAAVAPSLTVATQRQSPELAAAPGLVRGAMLGQADLPVAINQVPGQLPWGRIVTVRAEARTDGGGLFLREVLLRLPDRPGDEPSVLDWRRGS